MVARAIAKLENLVGCSRTGPFRANTAKEGLLAKVDSNSSLVKSQTIKHCTRIRKWCLERFLRHYTTRIIRARLSNIWVEHVLGREPYQRMNFSA